MERNASRRLVATLAWVAAAGAGLGAGCDVPTGSEPAEVVGGNSDDGGIFASVVKVHGNLQCSGTLVRRDRVVTAAHCVSGRTSVTIQIVAPNLGINALTIEADVHVHPDYRDNPAAAGHHVDLAVLSLRQPAPAAIALAVLGGRTVTMGSRVWVAGFGGTDCNVDPASLTAVRRYGFNSVDQAAAGLIKISNDDGTSGALTWHGDSGGPLFVREGGINYLVGVTHTGLACVWSSFVDVVPFATWLDAAVLSSCPSGTCGNGACALATGWSGTTLKSPDSAALYHYNGRKHGYLDGDCYHSAQCDPGYSYTCVARSVIDSISSAPAPVCGEGSFFSSIGRADVWRLQAGRRRPLTGAWTAAKFSALFGGSWSELVVEVCLPHLDRYSQGAPIWPPCGAEYGACVGAGEVCVGGECRLGGCGDGVCGGGETCASCPIDCGACPDDGCDPSTSDVCVASTCGPDPGSLLADGDFSSGWACWEDEDHFGHATVSVDTSSYGGGAPSAMVTVAAAGLGYEVQVRQRGIAIVAGHRYRLRVWARASAARTIIAEVGEDGAPWANRGLYAPIAVGTAGAAHTAEFVATVTDPAAKLGFQVGDRIGTVWLDDVRIEELGALCACPDLDSDGFFALSCSDSACAPRTDCDDGLASVNPAHSEICGNGFDDDCSAATSDGCTATCALDPGSILADGDFSGAWNCWEEEDHFGHASVSVDAVVHGGGAPAIRVTVTTAGLNYEVQARQRGVAVVAGQHYRLTFWARATSARQIIAEVGQDGAPWANRGLYAPIAVGTEGGTYTALFVATVTDPAAKFGFQVGDRTGTIWFDDVRIAPE